MSKAEKGREEDREINRTFQMTHYCIQSHIHLMIYYLLLTFIINILCMTGNMLGLEFVIGQIKKKCVLKEIPF